jgi:hypothetical protein
MLTCSKRRTREAAIKIMEECSDVAIKGIAFSKKGGVIWYKHRFAIALCYSNLYINIAWLFAELLESLR